MSIFMSSNWYRNIAHHLAGCEPEMGCKLKTVQDRTKSDNSNSVYNNAIPTPSYVEPHIYGAWE